MASNHGLAVLDGFRDLLKSGEFSDIAIICGERRFAVHKVVIFSLSILKASQSFATNTIDLSHHDLHLVARMIEYFYSGTYDDPTDEDTSIGSRLILHAEMFALADKYDVPGLGEKAIQYFQSILPNAHLAEYVPCIRTIYGSTLYSSARFREIIVNHVVEQGYMGEENEKLLKAAFIENPRFGWDCYTQLQSNTQDASGGSRRTELALFDTIWK
ncbi:hypothetical protein MMC07_006640 [Pseudocyphellaria aurata]|nr:hypothetical protein [Pseudocyphellaria aurata]